MILAADYSQLELRVLAHLSKDRRLLEVTLCHFVLQEVALLLSFLRGSIGMLLLTLVLYVPLCLSYNDADSVKRVDS